MFDPFGFNKAIQIDHLTDEQLDEVAEILTSRLVQPDVETVVPGDVDLPEGYRWATGDETEADGGRMEIPGAMMVTRTFDSAGVEYTDGEADLAVPIGTDLDYEPCCYNSTRNFGTGEHEWGCPNY